jgi:hypothetical protein
MLRERYRPPSLLSSQKSQEGSIHRASKASRATSGIPSLCQRWALRFAARRSGLASGLALAVRPAGAVEAPGSTARRRRIPRSGMRSTVDAGGAAPDNARRSDPATVTLSGAPIGAPGARVTAGQSLQVRYRELRRGPHAAGTGAAERGSRRVRRASVRRTRAKLPPRDGESPGEPQPLTPGHPAASLPGCSHLPSKSRPGRQVRRAEGVPLKP